jgi:hypothetical protein
MLRFWDFVGVIYLASSSHSLASDQSQAKLHAALGNTRMVIRECGSFKFNL